MAFRGRELCPGGRMVVLTMALDENVEFAYQAMNDALITSLHELATQGLVQIEEVRRMVIPVVARSDKDFRAPFAPRGWFEGLTIGHLEVSTLRTDSGLGINQTWMQQLSVHSGRRSRAARCFPR